MTQAVGSAAPSQGPGGEVRPPLPISATLVAVLGLAGEVVLLADDGLQGVDDGTPVSMVLTAAVVAWVSYGVLTGRTVRRILALAMLGLSALVDSVDLVLAWADSGWVDGWDVLYLVTSIAMFGALLALVRSPWDAWQRRHHDGSASGAGAVVLLAALVGLLGPLAGPGPEAGKGFHVQLNLGHAPLTGGSSAQDLL